MAKITFPEVKEAAKRIAPFANKTPVFTSSSIDNICKGKVFLKCENFQKTGSFKFRGATNAVSNLNSKQRSKGVVAHSSGNHAQALALAAKLHSIPAYIVMPKNASPIKRLATEGYGAKVIECEPNDKSREETAKSVMNETGATFIHPHDDLKVIAGQGTAAMELIDEIGDLDIILAPIGGGGLISGTITAAKSMLPKVKVIGCEPAGADDAARSLKSGRRITDFTPDTIADGLLTSLGQNGFEMIRDGIDDIITVTDEEIVQSMRFIWERMKIIIEPSSAVAVAPILKGKLETTDKRTGIIISGGNIDLERFFDNFN